MAREPGSRKISDAKISDAACDAPSATEIAILADRVEEARVRRDECECNNPEYPERECSACRADRLAGEKMEATIHAAIAAHAALRVAP